MEHAVTDPEGDLDTSDQAILDRLAAVSDRLDPPPDDLDDRVLFAVELTDLDAEVARLTEESLIGAGARASERTRTITFDADSRTIMVTVVERADGRVRIDGWLAPAVAAPVTLRSAAESWSVDADAAGRFVFDGVPHGLAQLRVDAEGAGVVTPSLVL